MGLGLNGSEFALLNRLKSRMNWHEARQTVLASNIANSDTPGYRARDLKPPVFSPSPVAQVLSVDGLRRTSVSHMAALPMAQRITETRTADSFEMTPERNAVVLEQEMMKITSNQLDYQTVSTLYARTLGFLRTATRS